MRSSSVSFNQSRLFMIYFLINLSLSSCGGGGGGGVALTDLKVTVLDRTTPLAGVTVQLDSTGTVTAKTDPTGTVTFSNIASGPHDVHVYSEQNLNYPVNYNGKPWVSVYQFNGPQIYIDLSFYASTYQPQSSFISLLASVSNLATSATGLEMVLVTSKDIYTAFSSTSSMAGTYSASMSLSAIPSGTTVTGTLYALELSGITNAVSDAVNLGNMTFTTAASNATAPVNINVAFHTVKPSASNLAVINNVQPPAGIVLSQVSILDTSFSVTFADNTSSLTFPLTLNAYDPFNLNTMMVRATGSSFTPGVFSYWYLAVPAAKGGAPALATTMTSLPAAASGQVGPAFTFTPSGGPVTFQSLSLQAGGPTSQTVWVLVTPPGDSHVTLPALPPGMRSVLASNTSYSALLIDLSFGTYTYQQILTTDLRLPTPPLRLEAAATAFNFKTQ